MKHLLYTLVLLLSACGGGGDAAPVPEPVAAPVVAPVAAPPPLVVFIGDSITAGWDVAAAFPKFRTVNLGVSGQTSVQMFARFAAVLALKPDIVVIEGGTNDAEQPIRDTNGVYQMAITAEHAGIRPIVLNVMSRNIPRFALDVDTLRARIIAFNADLKALCLGYGWQYVDDYSATVLPDGSLDPALTVDGEHPNDAGRAVMARLVQSAIKE